MPIARKHLLPDPLFFRCIFSGRSRRVYGAVRLSVSSCEPGFAAPKDVMPITKCLREAIGLPSVVESPATSDLDDPGDTGQPVAVAQ